MDAETAFAYPEDVSQEDRIVGAIMGTFIGDALGVGCQWYYEPGLLQEEFGPWIDDYVDPKADSRAVWGRVSRHRYERGVRAGDGSQTADYLKLLLASVASNRGYVREQVAADLGHYLDGIDGDPGDPYAGIWTDEIYRVLRKARLAGLSWDDDTFTNPADSADCAVRGVILAGAHRNPVDLAGVAFQDSRLFFQDPFLVGYQLACPLFVQGIINGVPLAGLDEYMHMLGNDHRIMRYIRNFDSIGVPTNATAAWDPEIRSVPASKYCAVFGLACQAVLVLPAAYFLAFRYPDDFEMAVLSAINGGGNNMTRATVTGGIAGAMVGIKGIPERFVSGLRRGREYLALAEQVAGFAVGEPGYDSVTYDPNDDALPHSADEVEGG